ncbi:glutamine amidotransferase [Corynebacterium choanae]|uniref:GMP synthase [glutamine-hydrolyzing] n=1 Tax=Corynebacterium choanae TaxID=1862358 RepID=A0A3G6J6B1_9CORY|nr:glutamine amidotransferase [Corynebacterium choanae]AZA13607.1 GMP synthase [glutamine-hydrolyzing] [Corynebacterium choanae]
MTAPAIEPVHTTRPFLLLSTRAEDDMTAQEYESFLRLTGLTRDTLVGHRVEQHPFDPIDVNKWAGIIIGGSPYNATEPVKSRLQQEVERTLRNVVLDCIEQDSPLFGACYGVGTIATTAGGTVDRRYGEEAACIEVHKTANGKMDPLLYGIPDTFATLVGHKEACARMPRNATLLVEGERCPIQMFRLGENIYVTQFHPELEEATFIARLAAYRNDGYYPPEEYERIVATLDGKDLTFAPRMLNNFAKRYAD